jgi:hypothetical protein
MSDRLRRARQIYARIGESFDAMLEEYLENGYVISTPDLLLIGKTTPTYSKIADTWHVEYADGNINAIVIALPFWLPYVSFCRKGRLKVYATATLVNKVLRNETIQNGRIDPVLWRRWSGQDQAPTSSGAIDGSGERCQTEGH